MIPDLGIGQWPRDESPKASVSTPAESPANTFVVTASPRKAAILHHIVVPLMARSPVGGFRAWDGIQPRPGQVVARARRAEEGRRSPARVPSSRPPGP